MNFLGDLVDHFQSSPEFLELLEFLRLVLALALEIYKSAKSIVATYFRPRRHPLNFT